jgi:glycosyltransferase involved in cell wall biosynthesis
MYIERYNMVVNPGTCTVSVIIPCRNEEATIGRLISKFHELFPNFVVIVVDNNSSDQTAKVAFENGAVVLTEDRPGKGWAVRRGLSSVKSDFYIVVDGDGTYEIEDTSLMLQILQTSKSDMLIGVRREIKSSSSEAYRRGHVLGNRLLSFVFQRLFLLKITDTLSGFRIMTDRFVSTFSTNSKGFELETDFNVHAAQLGCGIIEYPVKYYARPAGSESKLRTYRDGVKILSRNLTLFHDARPFLSFALLGFPWFVLSFILLVNVLRIYFQTGEVLPSLIISVSSFLVSIQLLVGGLVAERTGRARQEQVRLFFNQGK